MRYCRTRGKRERVDKMTICDKCKGSKFVIVSRKEHYEQILASTKFQNKDVTPRTYPTFEAFHEAKFRAFCTTCGEIYDWVETSFY